ncbi:phospholipase domain-containing protein [Actinosynnema sp. NPDC091369]
MGRAAGASTVDTTGEVHRGEHGDGPYGLGPRIPLLVVSPWSTGGWVCSEVVDHTSIIRFLETRFGVLEPNITPWRRQVCGDLTSAFDFARADTALPPLPDTSGYRPPDRDRHPDVFPEHPEHQVLSRQEPGRRYARPLPHDLASDCDADRDHVTVTFANHGTTGATFHVTAANPPSPPRTYTVEPGKHLSDRWLSHDVRVHGPNGYLRQFTDAADIRVHALHRADTRQVRLTVTDTSPFTRTITITDTLAGGVTTTTPARDRTSTHDLPCEPGTGWYDLTVTAEPSLGRGCASAATSRPGHRASATPVSPAESRRPRTHSRRADSWPRNDDASVVRVRPPPGHHRANKTEASTGRVPGRHVRERSQGTVAQLFRRPQESVAG